MSLSKNVDRWRGWLKVALLTSAFVAAAVSLAACGGSGSTTGGSETAAAETKDSTVENAASEKDGSEESGEATVSAGELQQTVNQAMETEDIKADTLPPLMAEAFERATPEPTKAEMETAYKCWKENSCTVGDGPITLGLLDGADNTWRQFTKMNVILQAMTYPEVGKIILTNAGGNLATYQANLRTLTAQGATAIAAYNDFGPAAYPAFTAAQREGAFISTYVGYSAEVPASAITNHVEPDQCAVGEEMAELTEKVISANGPVAYFQGTPGNPQDTAVETCAAEAGLEIVFKEATEWTPAGAQKVAAALVASGKPVKAILYTYSNPVPGIVDVFKRAGEEIPAIITWTRNNETSCQWEEDPYTLYQTNSENWAARVSVDAVVLAAEGKEVEAETIYPQPFIREEKGKGCDKSKPAEYGGVSAMTPEFLTEKMLAGQ